MCKFLCKLKRQILQFDTKSLNKKRYTLLASKLIATKIFTFFHQNKKLQIYYLLKRFFFFKKSSPLSLIIFPLIIILKRKLSNALESFLYNCATRNQQAILPWQSPVGARHIKCVKVRLRRVFDMKNGCVAY